MKYNTEKNKLVMLPSDVKSRLDGVITLIVKQKIARGETRLKVSYADAIKWLLEISNTGI